MFWREMSSPPRSQEREEERRLSIRTLAIASLASATAAILTSQFWVGGTPIAAAVTPVIVALVSEMLHRPTEAIARRVTSERTAILDPPVEEKPPSQGAPRRESTSEPPVRVYSTQRPALGRRRKIAVGVVATTAVLAFAIAAVALTVPELITGRSLVKSDRNTTLVPTKRNKDAEEKKQQQEQQTTPTVPEEKSPPATSEEDSQRTETTPTETETTPSETETTPKNQPK
jgi:hypothetical protein